MGTIATQITNLTIVYSIADQRKHPSSVSVAFVCVCVGGGGGSLGTDEFPAQMASNAENVSIWWRHHEQLCVQIYWMYCNITVTGEIKLPLLTISRMPDDMQK